LGLLGLGSVGVELGRLDQYSDLDFFLIVKKGSKSMYLDSLFWLSDVYPLAYSFRNTVDGYKILFEDGIYGEFAVFEEDEMDKIAYSEGRWIFKKPICKVSNIQIKPLNLFTVTTLILQSMNCSPIYSLACSGFIAVRD
jgi:hypothetical protein